MLNTANSTTSPSLANPLWDWLTLASLALRNPQKAPLIFSSAGVTFDTLRAFGVAPEGKEPYGRKILFRSDFCEIMLATWAHAVECAPHDHGFSNGLVWLVSGQFIESHYELTTELRFLREQVHEEARAVVSVDEHDIHSMRAPRGGLSLHVYSPPIHKMKVYDKVQRRTLTVSDDCGAWIPENPELIMNAELWPNNNSL